MPTDEQFATFAQTILTEFAKLNGKLDEMAARHERLERSFDEINGRVPHDSHAIMKIS